MPDLKELFLLDPNVIYLNHGSFGATPKTVFRNYQSWQRKLEFEPVLFLTTEIEQILTRVRRKLASYLHTSSENILLIPNATYGVNMVARSLNLREGDEILTTDHEYGACDLIWKFICLKTGAQLKRAHIPLPFPDLENILGAIWKKVTPKTRLIFLSHIASPTSVRFPIEKIVQDARRAGILTLIDGAHAPGQVDLYLDELGADYYTGNCHKWMLAPKGSAFLYSRPERQELLEPLIVSWGWDDDRSASQNKPYFSRFEWLGTRDPAAYLSIPAAIEFQEKFHWEDVRKECHQLARQTMQNVCNISGIPPIYPDESYFAQMVTIPLPPIPDPVGFKSSLYHLFNIEIPVMEWNGVIILDYPFKGTILIAI